MKKGQRRCVVVCRRFKAWVDRPKCVGCLLRAATDKLRAAAGLLRREDHPQ